jgi:hypothetical protein
MTLCRKPKKVLRKTFKVCACGCGERLPTAYHNRGIKFKRGHNNRKMSCAQTDGEKVKR